MSERTEFDIIFVGGGAAGCVAAGRLAAANSNLKILILEAGPHSLNVDTHVQPARYIANFLNPNKLNKSFTLHVAQPSEAVANRKVNVAASRVLGGGSSVNFMVYTRASASDYDTWEVVHENPGWGSKELIPLLKEIETYTLPTSNSTHGKEGPLRISFPDNNVNVGEQFLDVAGSYDKERRVTEDWNNFETGDGYGIWAKYINDKTGRRSDTAHNFVYSQPENKNLTVLAESRAVRVLFEGTRAVGVEYVTANAQSPSQVYASKLVVLSSGAFGSPAILERSGIGGEDALSKNGVIQLVDLPGVGENYKDHNTVATQFAASPEAETMSHIFHATSEEALQSGVQQWKESGKGWISHNGIDAGCKLRPSLEDVQTMGPAFEKRWKEFFESSPDKPVVFAGTFAGLLRSIVPRPTLPDATEKYFGIQYVLAYPASAGSVHITDALDPYAPLNFRHGYLEEEADVAELRWLYKHLREIARRMPLYRGELPEWHPTFPVGSDAASKAVNTPVGIDAPKLVYTAEDDAAIDEFHRNRVSTAWHSMGTCAMKPRDEGGVVDSRLNVYGTKQLKIYKLPTVYTMDTLCFDAPKIDFQKLSSQIFEYIVKRHQSKPLYASFVEQLARDIAQPLTDVKVRKVSSSLTTLSSEKQKEQKDKAGGNKTKAAKPIFGGSKVSGKGPSPARFEYV